MSEKIQREKLYEDVWSVPMTRLCKSYGLSYQRLRKLCVELNISIPKRGHWAKVALGTQVARPELPLAGGAEKPSVAKSRATAAQMKEPLSPVSNRKSRDRLNTSFHPLIGPVAKDYFDSEKDALLMKAKFDWEQSHPGRRYSGPEPRGWYGGWERFCEEGQTLCATRRKSILRVSLQTFRRALKLLNDLANCLEESGFRLQFAERRECLVATRGGAEVSVRVVEKRDESHRLITRPGETTPSSVRTYSSTGRLTVSIRPQGYGEAQLSDRPGYVLEEHWDEILFAVEAQHAKSVQTIAEWAAAERKREEAIRRQIEDARQREEARRREEAEMLKRQGLIQEAADWRTAETIRAYLAHLEHCRSEGGIPSSGYEEWREWAGRVADSLDKSGSRVLEIGPGPEQP